MRPAPAPVTATKLLAESGGTWNDDLRSKALQLFLADAANLIFCLVMPDVFARPRLLKDERFKGEQPGSCKLSNLPDVLVEQVRPRRRHEYARYEVSALRLRGNKRGHGPPGLQGSKGGMAGTANKRPTSPSPLDPGNSIGPG